MNYQVDILLSTYDGAKYLPMQLDSILDQDYENWRLLVRDDCSLAGTVEILDDYCSTYPGKICTVSNNETNLGPALSFGQLVKASSAPYVCFCDQDDVWRADKLRLMLSEIKQVEIISSEETPVLVHTDLCVVDEGLDRISDSFWRYQHLEPGAMQSLNSMLIQNCVTGCASIMNRALVRAGLPVPQQAIMHDWWYALVAATTGRLVCIDEQPILYRQHGDNDVGAKRWGLSFILNSFFKGQDVQRFRFLQTRDQAEALLKMGISDSEHEEILQRYVGLYDKNWLQRRLEIIQGGFFKYGIIKNMGLFLWI